MITLMAATGIFLAGAVLGGLIGWFIRAVIADVHRDDEEVARRSGRPPPFL